MSTHQIIYTSCRRGIDGGGDGMQIYSRDAAFQGADEEELGLLFSYQPPDMGRPMTDELARTMPQAYKYQHLRSGARALALNTYLGRDYMGERGRFGYHMSHAVICDPEDMSAYPAEYYGGEVLRSSMTFEEVSSPDPPPALPAPALERSFAVTPAAAAGFLAGAGRMEVYERMLCAVLSFQRTGRQVVILDESANVILWIAALGYALPKRNAAQIDFSTYEYAPALSPSRVCGAARGGRWTGDEGRRLVFDLLSGDVPALEPDPAFSRFLRAAFVFPCEELWDFHDFLDSGCDYDRADEDLYGGYALYRALTGGPGRVTAEQRALALEFAGRSARPAQFPRIARRLLPEGGDGEVLDAAGALLRASAAGGDATRLTGMALALEEVLRDRPGGAEGAAAMWNSFGDLLPSCGPAGVQEAYAALGRRGRCDLAYLLYLRALSRAAGPEERRAAYEAQDRALAQTDPGYAASYGGAARDAYRAACASAPQAPAHARGSILRTVKDLFRRRES